MSAHRVFQLADAGIHFMNVLKRLGIDTELSARLHPFPNGATATAGLIGCTQVTEILYTPGSQPDDNDRLPSQSIQPATKE